MLIFVIKLVPNATKYAWKLDKNGMLKCYVTSPAIDGRANAELIKKLAKELSIAPSAIIIVSGITSRIKKIGIEGILDYREVLKKLKISKDNEPVKQLKCFMF